MQIPEGYKLVPVEPTGEMINAGFDGFGMAGAYAQMLAAAPTPPQPIYDEAKERELFEAEQDEAGGNIDRDWLGDYENPYVQSCWDGWSACAQSRAKAGEVCHE